MTCAVPLKEACRQGKRHNAGFFGGLAQPSVGLRLFEDCPRPPRTVRAATPWSADPELTGGVALQPEGGPWALIAFW